MRQTRRIFSSSRSTDDQVQTEDHFELGESVKSAEQALTPIHSDLIVTQTQAESGEDEEEHLYGLFELWPNVPAGEPSKIKTTVDIIAVHGLAGGAYKTWTKADRLWLRGFLPNECPEARILTFGYDASVAFARSESRIPDFALQLLAALQALRRRTKSDPSRKIAFICHSLGGIVVKQALITAHALSDKYGWFTKNTLGIIFLGTPHHGSDTAYWGRILGNIANISIRKAVRTDLLKDLQQKSHLLGDICSAFPERGKSLIIYTFFERVKTPGLNGLVVDKDSAMLYLPNETAVPLETTHRDLCRFLTGSNQNYLLVVDAILAIIESAEPAPEISNVGETEAKLLVQLARIDIDLMLEAVPDPKYRSCQWIIGNKTFKTWRDSSTAQSFDSHLLWIFGPPGTGKTVMSKYIINHLKSSLPQNSVDGYHNIAYFFCDDKIPLRQSEDELLASILYQIFNARSNLSLMKLVEQGLLDRFELFSTSNLSKLMWSTLTNLVRKCRGQFFWIIIDALDELTEGSRERVVVGLQSLLEGDWSGRLKVIITSRSQRPSALLSKITEDPVYLDLRNKDTQADVDRLLEVQAAQFYENLSQFFPVSKELQQSVESTLKRLAGGNFLQADLALSNFQQNTGAWTRNKFLEHLEQVESTPANLQDFYCALLAQIPRSYESTAKLVFSCILSAVEQLTVQDLGIILALKNDHSSYRDVKAEIPADFYLTFEEHCGFMVLKNEQGIVQLRHQSAKELLLGTTSGSEGNKAILERYRISLADAHSILANVCLKILSWSEFAHISESAKQQLLKTAIDGKTRNLFQIWLTTVKGPSILLYAAKNWSEHCSKASSKSSCDDAIFRYFSKPNFNIVRLALAQLETDLYRHRQESHPDIILNSPPLHYLLQKGDFPKVVHKLLKDGADVNELDGHGLSPLHWAVTRDRQNSFHVLSNYPGINVNRRAKGKSGFSVSHQCVEWERVEIFQYLLEDERVRINLQDSNGNTALSLAMIYSQKRNTRAIVELILDRGRDVDFAWRSDVGLTLLEMAFKTCRSETVIKELLRQHDIKYDSLATNILKSAGENGLSTIEEEILRSNTDQAFRVDSEGLNTLTSYAFFGRKANLLRLLDLLGPDAFSVHQKSGKYDLLHLCAHQDWEDVVITLQSKFKMRSLDSDHYGRTLLHWAIEYGWNLKNIDLTSTSSDWIDRQDRDGLTPLHLAVATHNLDAVRLLVGMNANFLLKDREGSNAVHAAASQGFSAAIKIFLAEEVREYKRTRTGASLLHLLVLWSDKTTVELYVTQKRPIINVFDKERKTPLHYAAICGNEEVIDYLIELDANIDSIDLVHQTPLHCAIREGCLSTVKRLVEAGADLWKQDSFKQSCLQLSIRNGNRDVIEYILESVDSVKNRDVFGKTALHRACKLGDAQLVTTLLRRGIDCNTYDRYSQTPLHVAVMSSNIDAVRALLNGSARGKLELSPRDSKSTTPLDRALYNDHEALVALLGSWGAESTRNYKLKIGLEEPYIKYCQGHHLAGGLNRQIATYSTMSQSSTSRQDARASQPQSTAGSSGPSRQKAEIPKTKPQQQDTQPDANAQKSKPQQQQKDSTSAQARSGPRQPGHHPAQIMDLGWACTKYPFRTEHGSNALSFMPGSIIRIIRKPTSDWWIGIIDGVQGGFPVNHTYPIFETDTYYAVALLVHSAHNIRKKSLLSNPDAYVSISVSSSPDVFRTAAKTSTTQPSWVESFVFDVKAYDTLTMHVFDERRQRDGRLGSLGLVVCEPLRLLQYGCQAWNSGVLNVPLSHRDNPTEYIGTLSYSLRVAGVDT